jgi:hypothetical protein
MSISTTPPPAPPKKGGMGCLGCGCLVLALLAILFVGLVAGGAYLGYTKVVGLTSTTPADIPSFEGGDDLYQAAKQKVADFDHDVKNHQAATIQLSADELNALIAHAPDVTQNNLHLFVTLTDNECRLQASLPTDGLSHGIIKGRYFNFDASFEVHFDPGTRNVNLTFDALQFGDKVLLGEDASNQSFMRSFAPAFNQSFNNAIRQNPDGAALLDQAKSIEIQNGQLVIETQ